MLDFVAMVTDDGVPMEAVAAYLDGLPPAARREAAHALRRKEQRALYRKALASKGLTLADFVPADRAALTAVRHAGRNTLPLPGKHTYFEKRFCRPEDGSARLFGYNEAPSRGLIGPGYFVARSTEGEAEWTERGAIVVDYFLVPDGPVVAGWPTVVPNNKGLQVLVYHRTRDFMRRVSTHVTIGAAWKGEKSLDHYFVLVRQD